MNLEKYSTYIYIITIFVLNVIQAENSCRQEWFDMKAYNAIGKYFNKKKNLNFFFVLKSTYLLTPCLQTTHYN